MKLTSLQISNLHGISASYSLDDLTYFVGLNGAGKTTILQGIQLALLGYIPGQNKTNASIMRNCTGPNLGVVCLLDDEGTTIQITRNWMKNKNSVLSTVDIQPSTYSIEDIMKDIELPIFNFADFRNQSANALKDWFIQFLPSVETDIDWNTNLHESLNDVTLGSPIVLTNKEMLKEVLQSTKDLPKTVEGVKALNTHLKGMLSGVNARIKHQEGAIATHVYYDDVGDSEEDIEQIQAQISILNSDIQSAYEQASRIAERDRLRGMLNSELTAKSAKEDAEYQKLTAENESVSGDLTKAISRRTEIYTNLTDLTATIRNLKSFVDSNGVCPYSNSVCAQITPRIEQSKDTLAEMQQQFDSLQKELDGLNASITKIRDLVDSNTKIMAQIQAKYDQNAQVEKMLDKLGEVTGNANSIPDCQALESERAKLNEKLSRIRANIMYNQTMGKVENDMQSLTQDQLVLKRWILLTDANHMQIQSDNNPFEPFGASIDKILKLFYPRHDIHTTFVLTSKSNSFSFGYTRDGMYIPYDLMSSGEQCIFTVALMTAIVQNSCSPLKLILLDDVVDHLDPTMAKTFFECIQKITDIQFVLAGVQPCINKDADKFVREIKRKGAVQ